MISFIIIGRNIEKTISICIESVIHFVNVNTIFDYEIMYIDSESKDDSIKFAQQYPVRIFLITGKVNAAIGRNVGAKYAKGDILFFIDGDMELLSDFYGYGFDKSTKLMKYPFETGYLSHRNYDSDFNYLSTDIEKILDISLYRNVTGGLMIVERVFWEKLGGMDERLIRNQDLDFGLRMAKIGFPVLLVNQMLAIHHTISYYNKERLQYFFRSNALFSPGLLMRKHLFNKGYLKIYRNNLIYVFLLVISIIILFFKPIIGILLLCLYISIQILRTLRVINKEQFIFNSFVFKVLYNLYTLFGLLFYFPKNPKYSIIEITVNNI